MNRPFVARTTRSGTAAGVPAAADLLDQARVVHVRRIDEVAARVDEGVENRVLIESLAKSNAAIGRACPRQYGTG
jgi:hypothetical protein